MIGMVFGSAGAPFWPWQASHICAFASMSSAAYAGTAVIAKPIPAPTIVEKRRVNMAGFLPPVTAHGARETQVSRQSAQGATRPARSDSSLVSRHRNHPDEACSTGQAESSYLLRLSTESV